MGLRVHGQKDKAHDLTEVVFIISLMNAMWVATSNP